ncbi:hypothetical protein PIB30_045781 [Stylosanthes scabra]|uniref:Transposase n=1 Tax=Stylosanthes scabra TaxID=79078 RepID=A0ABU6WEB3_9FABA|nr:hypothetical protein [Stylosanthes scabra]
MSSCLALLLALRILARVKSSAELLKLYNIKIEKTNAENNKASLQAQGRKEARKNSEIIIERTVQAQKDVQERDQRITGSGNNSLPGNERTAEAAHDSLLRNRRASQSGNNHRNVEDETSEQHDNSSEDEEDEASDIMDPNKKGMSLDMYFNVHGINLDEEEDEKDEEEEEDENEGKEQKKTRGKTNCKKLHSSDFKDFEVVEFYEGQPIGPTKKVVSNLQAFVGTQKFILPIQSKKWVMQALFRAWKKYKGDVNPNHFMKYKTRKRMLKNRPLEIPEVQFQKLIRYWRLPEIKAMSAKNIENRSKQTCPHRTGSTGFGIVRKQLRDSKENKEEPSRAEIFTVTRTSRKGKENDPKSQSTIDELTSRIEAGQDHEEAFVQVLGKDQPGRLRCYGASVKKSSLKRHEEIRQVRGEYDEKVSSLERQMEGVCGLLTVMLQ